MTATPHNGKEEDFQLFMALLDGDRFEGRFRDGVHAADVSDLMRRMVKENLLKFDGTPLFPERIAYTVPYKLSDAEARLYKAVTEYVREEFNRAEALAERQARRHRRLRPDHPAAPPGLLAGGHLPVAAPPPGAAGEPAARAGAAPARRPGRADRRASDCRRSTPRTSRTSTTRPTNEVEAAEEEILDQATAARTIDELKAEIDTLKRLEALALRRAPQRRRTPSGASSPACSARSSPRRPSPTAWRSRRPYGAGPIPPPKPSPHRSWSSSPSTATR